MTVYFVHPSTDIDQSTYRPTLNGFRSTYISWVYQPTLSWYNNHVSVSVLMNASTEMSAEWWSTYWPTIDRYLGPYANHWLSMEYRSTVGGISVKSLDCQCISYTHFILFWSTSKICEGFMFGLHVLQIQSLSSKTLKWNTAKYTKYSWQER